MSASVSVCCVFFFPERAGAAFRDVQVRMLGPSGHPLPPNEAEPVIDIMFRLDLCVARGEGRLLVPGLVQVHICPY